MPTSLSAEVVQAPPDSDNELSCVVAERLATAISHAITETSRDLTVSSGASGVEYLHIARALWIVLASVVDLNPHRRGDLWRALSRRAAEEARGGRTPMVLH